MSSKYQNDAQKHIIQNIQRLISLKNFKYFAGYISIKNEVNLCPYYKTLLAEKNLLYFPKFNTQTQYYDLYHVTDLNELKEGKYGILEPNHKAKRLEDPGKKIDFWMIPGIAFDKNGNRLGWGKGYYDTLLKNVKGIKCGICYDIQVINEIPVEKHDITMDIIISESGIIKV